MKNPSEWKMNRLKHETRKKHAEKMAYFKPWKLFMTEYLKNYQNVFKGQYFKNLNVWANNVQNAYIQIP